MAQGSYQILVMLALIITCMCEIDDNMTSSDERITCPAHCRCSTGPSLRSRHKWHRLLAAHRNHRFLHGGVQNARSFREMYHDISKGNWPGRSMTCLGLERLPQDLPTDVSTIRLYGDTHVKEQYYAYQSDDPFRDDRHLSDERRDVSARYKLNAFNKNVFSYSNQIKDLVIEGNQINSIDNNDFDTLVSLKKLLFRRNDLETILPDGFSGLHKLDTLDLSGNKLELIQQSIFHHTPNLEKLIISNNRLKFLQSNIFSTLPNLKKLDLSRNFLTDLPKDVLLSPVSLQELILDDNQIEMIRPEWFAHIHDLVRLSIRNNHLVILQHSLFKPLSHMTDLLLSGNNLTELKNGTLEGCKSLRTVDLSRNTIGNVEPGALSGAIQMNSLNLGYNDITRITNESLTGMKYLTDLNLIHNNIEEIQQEDLLSTPHVARLDLSYNKIKIIRRFNFFGMENLKELRLEANGLRDIEDEAFVISHINHFSRLTWLYLQHNRIGKITSKAFAAQPHLKYLNLCYNNIIELEPGAFSGLKRLQNIVLYNNQLKNLPKGIFKELMRTRYINLAGNHLTQLGVFTFRGLNRVEDINLKNNSIDLIHPYTFDETPKLRDLDLSRNALSYLDLDNMVKLKNIRYVDASRNKIASVKYPIMDSLRLFDLNFADNHLRYIDENITKALTYGGTLHLYGNPIHCDCHSNWLLSVTGISLESYEDIVCKEPAGIAGERISTLDEEDFVCSNKSTKRHLELDMVTASEILTDDLMVNQASYHGDDTELRTTRISCGLLKHYRDVNTDVLRFRKPDVSRWSVSILDPERNQSCGGVMLTPNLILSPTACWKYQWSTHVRVIDDRNVRERNHDMQVNYVIKRVEHFNGPRDVSVIRVLFSGPGEEIIPRVYPCVLSEKAFISVVMSDSMQVVIDTTTVMLSQRHNLTIKGKVRLARLIRSEACPGDIVRSAGPCFEISTHTPFPGYLNETSKLRPVYILTGYSRWAIAGLSVVEKNEVGQQILPIYPISRWIDSLNID